MWRTWNAIPTHFVRAYVFYMCADRRKSRDEEVIAVLLRPSMRRQAASSTRRLTDAGGWMSVVRRQRGPQPRKEEDKRVTVKEGDRHQVGLTRCSKGRHRQRWTEPLLQGEVCGGSPMQGQTKHNEDHHRRTAKEVFEGTAPTAVDRTTAARGGVRWLTHARTNKAPMQGDTQTMKTTTAGRPASMSGGETGRPSGWPASRSSNRNAYSKSLKSQRRAV